MLVGNNTKCCYSAIIDDDNYKKETGLVLKPRYKRSYSLWMASFV
jgi:hypothetical protein